MDDCVLKVDLILKPQKFVLKETGHIAAGVFSMVAIMLIIYGIIGKFSIAALLGGIYTGLLAVANFFIMGLTVQSIAERASEENRTEEQLQEMTKHMKAKMQLSYNGRMIAMFALVVVGIAVLDFDPLATLLPLVFPRITIAIMGFLSNAKKKGSAN